MEELLYEQLLTPEEREAEKAEREAVRQEREAQAAERARREAVWERRHPSEWAEWVRLQPLLSPVIDFGGDLTFNFDDFLMEVGRAPSPVHKVVRKNKALPYQQGNLGWKATPPSKTVRVTSTAGAPVGGDILTKKEVSHRLRVSERTVNRWMSEGLLKAFRRGQVLRFKLEDVEAFVAKGRSGRRRTATTAATSSYH